MNAPHAATPDLAAMLGALVRDAVRDAVRDELADLRAELVAGQREAPPALLDRAGLARELGVSVAQVSRLRAEGLPCVIVGDSPRYALAEVLAWLRAREHAK